MDTKRRHSKTERQVRNAVVDAAGDLSHLGVPSDSVPHDRKAYAVLAEDLGLVADRVGTVLPARPADRYRAALRLLQAAADGRTQDSMRRAYGDRALRLLRSVSESFPVGFGEPPPTAEPADYATRDLVVGLAPELLRLASIRGFSGLVLFGSVARGEDDGGSDIDLSVIPGRNPATLFDLAAFSDDAEELLGRPVSAVSASRRSRIAGDIERDGAVLVG